MTSALPRTILVTGAAGFIGSALSKRLLSEGCRVIGIDDFNSYYPVELKEARVADIGPNPAFTLVRGDISDKALLEKVFSDYEPEAVVNLAAQAGVRYSIENPDAYTRSNLVGSRISSNAAGTTRSGTSFSRAPPPSTERIKRCRFLKTTASTFR